MSRARSIKPGFFRNSDLVELPMEARLLFIGLWTLADRSGRLEDRPKQIKMEIFPADNLDCNALIDLIAAIGMVARYEVDGKRYLQVVNFAKHQNPHRDEKLSTIPDQYGNTAQTKEAPAKHGANTVQAPCNSAADMVAIGLTPDSGLLTPDSLTFLVDSADEYDGQPLMPTCDAERDLGQHLALVPPAKPMAKGIPCPQIALLELYQTQLPDLAQPRKSLWLDGKNAPTLKARWDWVMTACHESGPRRSERMATTEQEGLAWFDRFFGYVAKSDHLMGRKGDWSCDLIWLVNKANFEKVITGNYINKERVA